MTNKKTIFILIGTRPNFIKVTQFKKCVLEFPSLELKIIHTGQHYDEKMADVFFKQFGLHPDHYLNIAPGSPNSQIAEIMVKLEKLCDQIGKPDLLLVPGDVNSTLAGALFANKSGIKLGHIEAGLRSGDRTMPEEFNRIITDELSDLFFVTEPSGMKHLNDEKKDRSKAHHVGNTMIDTMVAYQSEIGASKILEELKIEAGKFILMTMHRPATVDDKAGLEKLLKLILHISENYKVVFPIHPRTVRNLKEAGLLNRFQEIKSLVTTEPLDYFSFQKLIKTSAFILTDSGGIQEESTFNQIPCITLRPNTERPVTVETGSNTLLPFDIDVIQKTISEIESGTYKKGIIPAFWDGKSTSRILSILEVFLKNNP